MSSYNKVIMMGNLTRDVEVSYTPAQTALAKFGLACNEKFKGHDGQPREKACFVECVMFGKRAEVIKKYFKKGDPIFIEGKLDFQQWETKEGQKKSRHGINVMDFAFVGKRDSAPERAEQPDASVPDLDPQHPVFNHDDDIPF